MSEYNDFNASVIAEFRANAGQVGGQFAGAPLLLLHSTGAKSGAERIHPVMYLRKDGRYFVIASKAGAPTNPDWYYNLTANADASIEVGTETIAVSAAEVTGAERDAIYAEQAGTYTGFADYEAATDRVIPVIALTPKG